MNRFDRITAILIHLQTRKVVNAQELSERFEVSLRTIYRDIRTLEEAGVPIYGEAGVGYSIMDGYRLPPVMFTKDEASSFVTAEKLMEKFTDKTLGEHFQSAMYKVKAVLRSTEKDIVNDLESHIHINPSHTPFNKDIPNALDILLKSISERRIVNLNYKPVYADDPAERSIEPVGIFHENQYWYVLGFCHLRNDYRQFRADRMMDIKISNVPFTRKHGSLGDYRKNGKDDKPKTEVVILVERKIAEHLVQQRQYLGFVSEKPVGEMVEMTFQTGSIEEGFPRWFLMFADRAKIVAPEELKERVNELLAKMSENLKMTDFIK